MAKVDLAGKLRTARARVEAELPPEQRGLAKYAQLSRKDARIRPDQELALTALADALMRRRTSRVERITENTLIRVAIDLLLTRADHLRGSTEDELRNSVTSELPHSRTSELAKPETADAAVFRTSVVDDVPRTNAAGDRATEQPYPAPPHHAGPTALFALRSPITADATPRPSRAVPGDPVPTWHPLSPSAAEVTRR
ncbi:MAG: hypothetical protein ACTHNQ_18085 [Microbacterium sp.]